MGLLVWSPPLPLCYCSSRLHGGVSAKDCPWAPGLPWPKPNKGRSVAPTAPLPPSGCLSGLIHTTELPLGLRLGLPLPKKTPWLASSWEPYFVHPLQTTPRLPPASGDPARRRSSFYPRRSADVDSGRSITTKSQLNFVLSCASRSSLDYQRSFCIIKGWFVRNWYSSQSSRQGALFGQKFPQKWLHIFPLQLSHWNIQSFDFP